MHKNANIIFYCLKLIKKDSRKNLKLEFFCLLWKVVFIGAQSFFVQINQLQGVHLAHELIIGSAAHIGRQCDAGRRRNVQHELGQLTGCDQRVWIVAFGKFSYLFHEFQIWFWHVLKFDRCLYLKNIKMFNSIIIKK